MGRGWQRSGVQTFAALPDEQERTNAIFASHSTKLPWKWRCAADAGTFMRAQSECSFV